MNLHNRTLDNSKALAQQIAERKRYQEKKKEERQHAEFIKGRVLSVQKELYHQPWLYILHAEALAEDVRRDRRQAAIECGLILPSSNSEVCVSCRMVTPEKDSLYCQECEVYLTQN